MRAFACCLIYTCIGYAEDAAAIMSKVAANFEKASAERRQFVYTQSVYTRFLRTNGSVARQEKRVYTVAPAPETTSKSMASLNGEVHTGKQITNYSELGHRGGKLDLDGELIEGLTDQLVNEKKSRDGIPRNMFPLRTGSLSKYRFKLLETKTYKERPTHRISFEPIVRKEKCIDVVKEYEDKDCDNEIWKGEVYVDAGDLQPAHMFSELATKIPLVIRTVLGTNVHQTGFSATYRRVAPNVWFPVSYGTEFRLNLLFGYRRVITMALESYDFRRTVSDSNIQFETVR